MEERRLQAADLFRRGVIPAEMAHGRDDNAISERETAQCVGFQQHAVYPNG
jgi:hypothetical protein